VDIVVIGHISLDTIIIEGKDYIDVLGGPPAYISYALSSFSNIKVSIATSIGYDALSFVLAELSKVNVDFSPLITYLNKKTTRYVLLYKGDKRELLLKAKCGAISSVIGNFDVAIVSPIVDEVSLNLIKNVRETTQFLSLDPQGFFRSNKLGKVRRALNKELFSILPLVDIVKISEDEASLIDEDLIKCIRMLLNRVKRLAIITRGSRGSLIGLKEDNHIKVLKIPAYPISVKDPTGAGDVFIAVFTVQYLMNEDPLWAGCIANAAASLSTEGRGPCSIPYHELIKRAQVLLEKVSQDTL